MKELLRDKLFRLFFPGTYKAMIDLVDYNRKINKSIQKKEAVIQILQRKMRRMEREKKK